MQLLKKYSTFLVIFLVFSACCMQETEATRRVNRGRRTLTRTYFSGLAIPGWAMILCIAIAELIIGAVLYFILYKVILSTDNEKTPTYTPAPTHDTTPVTPPPPVTPQHATSIA